MADVLGFRPKKQATCDNCGAIIGYENNEVTSYNVRDYGGGSDTYYNIKCPNCKDNVNVPRP